MASLGAWTRTLAACAVVLAACAPAAEEAAEEANAPVIRVVGSSTVLPMTTIVVEQYRQQRGEEAPEFDLVESGTRAGFEEFCADRAEIAEASRPILTREMIACFRAGVRYVEIPVAFDGISVIVHPSNSLQSVTISQLQALWEPESGGFVSTWRQADRAWPDSPLVLFGPGAESGTFEYFTNAVLGETARSRTDYAASEHDDEIVNGIAGDRNALGYVGLAHYLRNQDRLKALAIDSGAGAIAPSADNVRSGAYAPLSRPIFLYVNAAALDRAEIAQFVEHYVRNAAAVADAAGYVSLPADAYASYLERVQSRRVGSAFSGAMAMSASIDEVLARPLIEPAS